MNKDTRKKIEIDIAPAILDFIYLPEKLQLKIYPLLGNTSKSCLEILNFLKDGNWYTFEEIAQNVDKNPLTISQILHSLAQQIDELEIDFFVPGEEKPRQTIVRFVFKNK